MIADQPVNPFTAIPKDTRTVCVSFNYCQNTCCPGSCIHPSPFACPMNVTVDKKSTKIHYQALRMSWRKQTKVVFKLGCLSDSTVELQCVTTAVVCRVSVGFSGKWWVRRSGGCWKAVGGSMKLDGQMHLVSTGFLLC